MTWKSDEDIVDIQQLEEPTESDVGESDEKTVNDIADTIICDV